MSVDPTKMPQSPRGEMALTVSKIAVSFVPVVGGAAAEALAAIIAPRLEQRRNEWFEGIAQGLEQMRLRLDDLTPEKLAQSDAFATTLLHASQIALRNHDKEKLEALRNAVLNTAVSRAPDEDLQQIFLDDVDTLTAWHLRLLQFFADPREWIRRNNRSVPNYYTAGIGTVLEEVFPDLGGRQKFYDLLYDDLSRRGLVDGASSVLHAMMTGSGVFSPRITVLGRQFLDFVTSPRELGD